jgi:hypothetical protein
MEIEIKDFNEFIIKCCKTIKECYDNLQSLLKDYNYFSADRAKIDRNLVKMSIASQKMLNLVMPLPSVGEIHGLPKEATEGVWQPNVTIVDGEHPSWDFKAWFVEKTSRVKKAIDKLMEDLELNPRELQLNADVPVAAEEYVSEMIGLHMEEIHHVNNAILSMCSSGRLSVSEVKVEDDK